MLRKFFLFLGIAVFAAGCSTKVDLNTDWQDTTIIYGLMDQHDEYHYVKINKAFLGDGSYYDYAMIRDSSEYKNLTAYIEELSNGVVVNTYTLRDTELVNRETDGVFYAPEQTLYYFRKTGLNTSNTYRITAVINEGTSSEKLVTGETSLIPDFTILNPTSSTTTTITIGTYDDGSSNPFNYKWHPMKFNAPSTADLYEIVWRIKWDEYTATDTTRVKYQWIVGDISRDANSEIVYDVQGEAFCLALKNAIPDNPAVLKRVFRGIDVMVYAASKDFETYVAINSPQNSLVQERPEFTNISNGLGLFSSRVHMTVPNKMLGVEGMQLLVYGNHTSHLLFCTDTTGPAYQASVPSIICD